MACRQSLKCKTILQKSSILHCKFVSVLPLKGGQKSKNVKLKNEVSKNWSPQLYVYLIENIVKLYVYLV